MLQTRARSLMTTCVWAPSSPRSWTLAPNCSLNHSPSERMPTLTRKEVEEIAMLARLHLESDEIQRMQTELGTILDHFTTLATVDTEGVPPMTHAVPMDLRLRADEPAESLSVSDALTGASSRDGDLFVVPAMIPSAGGGS